MRLVRLLLAAITAIGLVACTVSTVTVANREPLRQLARETTPDGSIYIGWRVYQDRCAVCHGPAATGGPAAPDLTVRIRDLGLRHFAGLVLQRYD